MKIKYQEHKVESVMTFFAEGFQIHGGKLIRHEWFYDSAKGAVVFKLYIDVEASDPKGADSVPDASKTTS